MAQTHDKQYLDKTQGVFIQHDYDEAVTLSTSFAEVLRIDCSKISESVIQFKNNDGAIVESYQIFGSAKTNPSFSDFTSDEWLNLLSSLTTYDHTTAKTIAAGTTSRTYESFSNPWQWVVVLCKSASGTPAMKVWHRGQNI